MISANRVNLSPGYAWRECQVVVQCRQLQLSPPCDDQLDGELHTCTIRVRRRSYFKSRVLYRPLTYRVLTHKPCIHMVPEHSSHIHDIEEPHPVINPHRQHSLTCIKFFSTEHQGVNVDLFQGFLSFRI